MVNLSELSTTRTINWCPACGNFAVLTSFKNVLIQLGLTPEEVICVTGIGCHGKLTNYINTCGFHGIHGRTLPAATGIKLVNPDLTVVCFAGDGDCYDEG